LRSLRILAVVVSLSVLAVACASSSKVDELKTELGDILAAELPSSVTVEDINCGDDPSLEAGSTFLCTAGISGARLRIQVTIDADGVARSERLNAIVDLERLELEISGDLLDGLGYEVAVDCGTGFGVQEVGSDFTCTVTASGEVLGVRVTVDDTEGNTDWFFPVAVGS